MKYLVLFFFAFLLVFSCSESDSDEMEIEKESVIGLPTLTTLAISEITQTSAISGGTISNDGGAAISARGVCWSTSSEPTITDNKTSDGTGKGEFSSSIGSLEANTNYFLRSFATSSEGTSYGNEISFQTLESEIIVNVFEGDLILTSQQEVNDFGAQEYTEINGNLTIEDSNSPSTIIDLSPLNSIQNIRGNWTILNNEILTKIEGLINAKTIEGALEILHNDSLKEINAFSELENLGNVLNIYNENAIYSLSGFHKLTKVNNGLGLISNYPSRMSILNAFENLETVDANFVLSGVSGQLNGFGKLEKINGAFTFMNSIDIFDFTFFESLNSIEGKLNVTSNSSLESFEGMESLTRINGLSLIVNSALKSFKGLENVTSITGDLTVSVNHELQNFEGLNGLERVINGGVDINQNFLLINLSGLENLKTIDAALNVWNNSSLISLDGLQNLRTLGNDNINCFLCLGNLNIDGNGSLENMDGLEGLEEMSTGFNGGIDITSNTTLKNLNGLKNIVPTNSSSNDLFRVNITSNQSLDDFCGLKKLDEFGASFEIIDNARLSIVLREELENCN